VYCTNHHILSAKVHARQLYPAAPVAKLTCSRVRIYGARSKYCANYLRRSDITTVADASNKNLAKGVKYLRLDLRKLQ
jgi:hypothetical protein